MRPTHCLGFVFTTDLQSLWMIEKQRPEWQKGRLNGIGGKVEEGENSLEAQIRETKEEAGVGISSWKRFHHLAGYGYSIDCFAATTDEALHTCTDERILKVEFVRAYFHSPVYVDNMWFLAPMARASLAYPAWLASFSNGWVDWTELSESAVSDNQTG